MLPALVAQPLQHPPLVKPCKVLATETLRMLELTRFSITALDGLIPLAKKTERSAFPSHKNELFLWVNRLSACVPWPNLVGLTPMVGSGVKTSHILSQISHDPGATEAIGSLAGTQVRSSIPYSGKLLTSLSVFLWKSISKKVDRLEHSMFKDISITSSGCDVPPRKSNDRWIRQILGTLIGS